MDLLTYQQYSWLVQFGETQRVFFLGGGMGKIAKWWNGDLLSLSKGAGDMKQGLKFHLSNAKNLRCLGCIGVEILPGYVGIIISHYKDPYKSISIMESNKGFFRGSNGGMGISSPCPKYMMYIYIYDMYTYI